MFILILIFWQTKVNIGNFTILYILKNSYLYPFYFEQVTHHRKKTKSLVDD